MGKNDPVRHLLTVHKAFYRFMSVVCALMQIENCICCMTIHQEISGINFVHDSQRQSKLTWTDLLRKLRTINILIVCCTGTHCSLGPFQVIPYGPNNSATQFRHDRTVTLKSCTLEKALSKPPDNSKEMDLQWLNESFVNLTVVNNILHFKVCYARFSNSLRIRKIFVYLLLTLFELQSFELQTVAKA